MQYAADTAVSKVQNGFQVDLDGGHDQGESHPGSNTPAGRSVARLRRGRWSLRGWRRPRGKPLEGSSDRRSRGSPYQRADPRRWPAGCSRHAIDDPGKASAKGNAPANSLGKSNGVRVRRRCRGNGWWEIVHGHGFLLGHERSSFGSPTIPIVELAGDRSLLSRGSQGPSRHIAEANQWNHQRDFRPIRRGSEVSGSSEVWDSRIISRRDDSVRVSPERHEVECNEPLVITAQLDRYRHRPA